MIFINKFNFFSKAKKVRVNTEKIVLKLFVDLDEDTIGWYALGHHDREDFLANFARQYPYIKLSCKQVELAWAKFENKGFLELIDRPINGSQPITLVEDLGEYNFRFFKN